jgi:hypothetical protein
MPPVMGALGEHKFHVNGNMVPKVLMYIVKDGKAMFYKLESSTIVDWLMG